MYLLAPWHTHNDGVPCSNQGVATIFYRAVCEILDLLRIPLTLADIGVPTDCAATIAEKAIQDSAAATHPRAATVQEIQSIIERAISYGR
jgi:alcohol dehydrogenase class IV